MTSEWVSEAQRIAKEAGEKAANEVADRANVALGWLTQNAPSAAMCVLESVVFRQEMPAPEVQRGYAQGDWARADAETQALAINDLLNKARDAALEEAAMWADEQAANRKQTAQHRMAAGYPDMVHGHLLEANTFEICANRIRSLKGRK